MRIEDKLTILADAAKYDLSCASSGSRRKNAGGLLGNAAPSGICHSYTEDGRCVSFIVTTRGCTRDSCRAAFGNICRRSKVDAPWSIVLCGPETDRIKHDTIKDENWDENIGKITNWLLKIVAPK